MSSSNCFFHISNVKASAEKPFEIKIDSNTVFSSTEDLIEKKTVTHDIPIPKFASVHNVYINILSPLNSLDELERYNLTSKGTHFIIDPTRSSNPVRQCFDESGTTQSPTTLSTAGSGSPRTNTPTRKSTATSTSSILGVKPGLKSSPSTTAPSSSSSSSSLSTGSNSPRQPTTTSNIRVPVSTLKPQTTTTSESGSGSSTTGSTTPRQSSTTTAGSSTGDLGARGEISRESVFDGVGNEETTLTFWLYGIEASVRYPFRILIDGYCLFRCEHDVEKTKVQLKVKEPKFSPEHKINLSVDMPLKTGVTNQDVKRIVNEKRYNLSASGKFFLIDFSKKDESHANVIQSSVESFSGYSQSPDLYDETKFEKRNDESAPSIQNTLATTAIPTGTTAVVDEYQVDASKLSDEQREKLLKVQSLEDRGILDKAEADFERRNIIGNRIVQSSPKTTTTSTPQPVESVEPVKQQEVPKVKTPRGGQQQQPQQPEFIELKLFLCNIKASPSQPFQLIYKPENAVMIELTEDVSPEKIICVKGEIPNNSAGGADTIAPLVIDMPKVGVKLEHSLNLKNGRFAMIGVSDNTTGKVVCRQQNDENFEGFIQDSGPKEEPSKIFVHFSGVPASAEQPFLIFINDKQAYKREEELKKRQKGCINGEIPKNKRLNAETESNHVVSVKVEAPMVNPNAKVVAVDLTNGGPHVFVSCNKETNEIIIKQGADEHSKDEDLRVCEEVGAAKVSAASPRGEPSSSGKKLTDQDIELLKKLADLKNAGILTENEYELKKKDILFGN